MTLWCHVDLDGHEAGNAGTDKEHLQPYQDSFTRGDGLLWKRRAQQCRRKGYDGSN